MHNHCIITDCKRFNAEIISRSPVSISAVAMLSKSKRVSQRCLRLDSKRVLGRRAKDRSKATQKMVATFVLLLALLHDGGLVGGKELGVLVKILLRHGKWYLESGYRSAWQRDWKFLDGTNNR